MVFLEPLPVLQLLAIGCCAGFLAGLLGVGGGMLMMPFVTLVLANHGVAPGLDVKMGIATSMATIVFTSLTSLSAHHRVGAVRWDLVRRLAPGIVIGGLLAGAGVFALLKGSALALIFALFVGYSATQLLLDRKPAPTRQMPGALGAAGVGAGIGFVSGLVGAGGAFLATPFMTWCNVPVHRAVGTSAALGFPVALASTLGYLISGWTLDSGVPGALGYLVLPVLAVISAASVIMAPLGARTAHALDTRQLRRVFAWLLYALAGYMAWRGLR